MSDLGQMVVKIVGDNGDFNKSIDSSEAKFKKFGETATKIGGGLTLAVTTPLIGLFGAAVKSAASMEMLQASFETMLGSASKASALMEQLKKMAAVTPFETEDLAQASKTLLQFGVSADKLIPTLKMLGDASGGSAAKFNSMALVFGQITSAGRLMGQDLLQLINAGFNPLKEISDRTGESMASLKKKMEQGAISADMVSESFRFATSQGGKFFNGMDTASKTLSGLISTLKDDVGTLGRSFVQDLMPFIKDVIKDLSRMAQSISTLSPETKKMLLVITGITASIGPLLLAIGGTVKAVAALKVGLIALQGAAGPVAIVLAGITAIAAALIKIQVQGNETRKTLKEMWEFDATKSAAENNERLLALLPLVNQAWKEANELSGREKEYAKARAEAVSAQYTLFANLLRKQRESEAVSAAAAEAARKAAEQQAAAAAKKAEQEALALQLKNQGLDSINEIIAAEKTEIENIDAQIKALTELKDLNSAQDKARIEAIEILNTRRIKLLNDTVEESREIEGDLDAEREEAFAIYNARNEAAFKKRVALEMKAAKAIKELDRDIENEKQKNADAEIERQKAVKEQTLELARQTFDELVGFVDALFSRRQEVQAQETESKLKQIDDELKAALEAAGVQEDTEIQSAEKTLAKAIETGDKEEIAEAQKALTKAKIEQEYADKKTAIEKSQREAAYKLELASFNTRKAFSIAMAVVDTASAAIKAFTVDPTGILSAITAAVGLAQIATIAAQNPPPPPSFANGGIVMPTPGGTLAQVAEAGQPEVIFPLDKLDSFLEKKNSSSGSAGDTIRLVVNLDSKPFLDKIFPATKNKTILISAGAVV